jgi:hypothetical protein
MSRNRRSGQPVFVSARDLPVRARCYAEYVFAFAKYSSRPLDNVAS